MGGRLDYREVGAAPDVVRFERNRRPIPASRVLLGEIQIVSRSLCVADPAWVNDVPALPIKIDDGIYPVYAYEWPHRNGRITVCIVIRFRPQGWAMTRRLKISNKIRPDLKKGIIVDSGEIAIQGTNRIVVGSGLGDGYYPVFENRHLSGRAQCVIIDFEVWKQRRNNVAHGLPLDEYGLPILDGGGPREVEARKFWDAVGDGDELAIEAMIAAGVDVNAPPDGDSQTPLHWAIECRQIEIVRRLIAAGAAVTDDSDGGWTPLVHAIEVGSEDAQQSPDSGRISVELIEMLLRAGAVPTDEALQVAREYSNRDALTLLERYSGRG